MPVAKINFIQLLLNSQKYESFNPSSDHMVSIVSFDLVIDGKEIGSYTAELRQSFGTKFATEPFEVSRPKGPELRSWDQGKFGEICELYFKSLIGPTGMAMRIVNCKEITMTNCSFGSQASFKMEIPNDSSKSW